MMSKNFVIAFALCAGLVSAQVQQTQSGQAPCCQFVVSPPSSVYVNFQNGQTGQAGVSPQFDQYTSTLSPTAQFGGSTAGFGSTQGFQSTQGFPSSTASPSTQGFTQGFQSTPFAMNQQGSFGNQQRPLEENNNTTIIVLPNPSNQQPNLSGNTFGTGAGFTPQYEQTGFSSTPATTTFQPTTFQTTPSTFGFTSPQTQQPFTTQSQFGAGGFSNTNNGNPCVICYTSQQPSFNTGSSGNGFQFEPPTFNSANQHYGFSHIFIVALVTVFANQLAW